VQLLWEKGGAGGDLFQIKKGSNGGRKVAMLQETSRVVLAEGASEDTDGNPKRHLPKISLRGVRKLFPRMPGFASSVIGIRPALLV
jgi:hypothetical protein